MKAIILAAGEGKRLRPYTEEIPKCMVELNGKALLDWQVDVMHQCGINDIVVIKGYKAEKITRNDLRYYVNEDYSSTNMVSTLSCGIAELNEEVIISYGDIIYTPEVLNKVMNSKNDISVVVDLEWETYWKDRFQDPLDDAESLIIKDDIITSIGQSVDDYTNIQAQYIGLMKFNGEGLDVLKTKCSKAKGTKMYMTELIQEIINDGNKVHPIKINRGWFEVDSISDLELASLKLRN